MSRRTNVAKHELDKKTDGHRDETHYTFMERRK